MYNRALLLTDRPRAPFSLNRSAMPIYEYQCNQCEQRFDALQKISDKPLQECRLCGAANITKLVSAPSFRLSGSGWYETDFKTDRDKKKNLADSSSSSSDSSDKQAAPAAKSESASASTKTESGKSSDSGVSANKGQTAKNSKTSSKTD